MATPLASKSVDGLLNLIAGHPFHGSQRDDFERAILGDKYDGSTPNWSSSDPANLQAISQLALEHLQGNENLSPESRETLYCLWKFHRMRDAMLSQRPSDISRAWDSFLSEYLRWVRCEPNVAEASHLFSMIYQLRRTCDQLFVRIAGWSPVMSRLRSDIWRAIYSGRFEEYRKHTGLFEQLRDMSVLIHGPFGAGKKTIARAIGLCSYIPFDPDNGRFLFSPEDAYTAIDVSTVPETHLECNLFGSTRDYSVGSEDRIGILEECSKWGVIYLEGVEKMSAQTQGKLLEVCDKRTFSRIGEPQILRKFEGRLVVSVCDRLSDTMVDQTIREDLYFRLASVCIEAPTFYDRLQSDQNEMQAAVRHAMKRTLTGEDDYIEHEVEKCCEAIGEAVGPRYHWPGNVRELVQAVRRYATGFKITRHPESRQQNLREALRSSKLTGSELMSEYTRVIYDQTGSVAATARHIGSDRRTIKDRLSAEEFETIKPK